MSAFNRRRGHLDATGGREVCFCHLCQNQWYRDEHESLHCPSCSDDAVEIVREALSLPRHRATPKGLTVCQINPASDPRPNAGFGLFAPGRFPRPDPFVDSDPEEEDIDDHITGGPNRGYFSQRAARTPLTRDRHANVEANFLEFMSRFRGTAMGSAAPAAPRNVQDSDDLSFPGFISGGQPTVQHTTIRSGPSGSTHITVMAGEGPVDFNQYARLGQSSRFSMPPPSNNNPRRSSCLY